MVGITETAVEYFVSDTSDEIPLPVCAASTLKIR